MARAAYVCQGMAAAMQSPGRGSTQHSRRSTIWNAGGGGGVQGEWKERRDWGATAWKTRVSTTEETYTNPISVPKWSWPVGHRRRQIKAARRVAALMERTARMYVTTEGESQDEQSSKSQSWKGPSRWPDSVRARGGGAHCSVSAVDEKLTVKESSEGDV